MTPRQALAVLKSGNVRFVAGRTIHRNRPASVRATAGGQSPFGAIVSCMDSRVPVELVFDLTVGDVFSIRVAGNVVNPDILGSLEFAAAVAASGPGESGDRRYSARVAEANVRHSMSEIRRGSAALDRLLEDGAVRLVGGLYDVETGRARWLARRGDGDTIPP